MAEAEIKVGGMGGIGPRWTWDHTFEKPAGTKDMGGWTAAVYTEEQQNRLSCNEMGEPVKKKEEPKPVQGFGPRWTWDADFEKPAGTKDMGGWTASVYTEEQQKRLSCDEMGKAVEKKEEPKMIQCFGPRWTYDPDFEKPALRKDMGGWTASVYSAEQMQRLGCDEMGSPNRLTPEAFTEKIYGGLCRQAMEAQYKSYKGDFVQVFGEEFKPLDMMKGDSDYDRLMKRDEFEQWARAQDRKAEGIERPWQVSAQQLADMIYADAPADGLTKKQFLEKYSENKREFQYVFKVDAIKWTDFRKGDMNNDKSLSRDEFLTWTTAQDDTKKVQDANDAGDDAWKKLAVKKDNASDGDIAALADKVFGAYGFAAMKSQYEYFTNDFKDQFGEELKNLDFMKGDANYDRVTSKEEFLTWVNAQNNDQAGIERPWEMSAEQLADALFESHPDGLSPKDFADEYKKRKRTFDTLLKGQLKFSDFRKADENHDKYLTREEFLAFVTKKQAESLQTTEE